MSHTGQVTIDRNNTSFAVKLLEFFRGCTWSSEWDFLKYYQNIIRLYVTQVQSGSRGLLVNVMMGLGKSITAVAVAMEFINTHEVIMLMAKSIQQNMRESIKKYINLRGASDKDYPIARLDPANLDRWIDQHFSFVSMNAGNMLRQLGRAAQTEAEQDFAAIESRLEEINKLPSLDGKMIIVDEAHNLFRAITHGSKNAIGFYHMVMKARNLKIVFLTGTPIANNPFELVPCFNMLAGTELFPENYKDFTEAYVSPNGGILHRAEFQNRIFGMVSYVDHSSRQGAGLGRQSAGSGAEFPADLGTEIHRVRMSELQYVAYRLAREKELEESTRPSKGEAAAMTIPKSGRASTYRVHSRQLSNFAPPPNVKTKDPEELPLEDAASPKFEAIWQVLQNNPRQLHIVYSQFKGMGGLGAFSRFLQSKGMLPYNTVNWNTEESQVAQEDILEETRVGGHRHTDEYTDWQDTEQWYYGGREDGPADLLPQFSWRSEDHFLDQFDKFGGGLLGEIDLLETENHKVTSPDEARVLGVDPLYLKDPYSIYAAGVNYVVVEDTNSISKPGLRYIVKEQYGDVTSLMAMIAKMQSRRTGGGSVALTYAAITGDIPVEERKEIVKTFTSTDNAHGEKIMLLLITATGAESLDLKNVRHVHIMEPYWTYGRIEQVKFRGIRNDSHIALPPAEKNVKTHVYLAVPPSDDTATTDTEIYNDSLIGFKNAKEFTEATREVSIECMVNAESWCRVCSPTGQRLFGDFQQDLKRGDPCQPYVEKKITAESIEVGGQTYYYAPDSVSVFGYKIYTHDTTTKLHIQLQEDDSRFLVVLKEIENQHA